MSNGPHIIRMSASFKVHGKSLPGHPCIISADGVILPYASFLIHRAVNRNASHGSVLDEAYILRDWLHFLKSRGRGIWEPADDLLRAFAIANLKQGISERRVNRKVSVIFSFYWTCEFQLGLSQGVVVDPQRVVSGTSPALSTDLTYRRGRDGSMTARPRPIYGFTTLPSTGSRPTPDEEQISVVLDHLLSLPNPERAICYWLCATWMDRAGLRRAGVAGLTVSALSQALMREGIKDENGAPLSLTSLHSDEARDSLLTRLCNIKVNGGSNLFVGVTEKRRKHRFAPVPIDVVECTLDYIWKQRARLVAERGWQNHDSLFLSLKTGQALSAAAIGNVIKTAFNNGGVAGSGHRLRAAFTSRRIRAGVRRARERHGRVFDVATLLLEEAEALGHRRTDTLKAYVDAAVIEEAMFDDHD